MWWKLAEGIFLPEDLREIIRTEIQSSWDWQGMFVDAKYHQTHFYFKRKHTKTHLFARRLGRQQ